MDWERIKEKWETACGRMGFEGEDNPEYILTVANEIPPEYKQQFTDEIVNGVEVEWRGGKALHLAADWGRYECVKCLVEQLNADVNVRTQLGGTPLYYAARDDRINIIRYLVEKCDADVSAANVEGWSPLHRAAYRDEQIVVSYLSVYCDMSAKPTHESHGAPPAEPTALRVAEVEGNTEALKCLKFAAATSVESLVGPPTDNMAKYYLIMRYLKVGGYTVSKLSLPLGVLSSASYLPTYREDIEKDLRERNDTELVMGFTTLVDMPMGPEDHDDRIPLSCFDTLLDSCVLE